MYTAVRVAIRVAIILASIGVGVFAIVRATEGRGKYDVTVGVHDWGVASRAVVVAVGQLLGAAVLAAGVVTDAIAVQHDVSFWTYAFVASAFTAVSVAARAGAGVFAFVAAFGAAMLFAASAGVAEAVWREEGRRVRGRLGWASTPVSHFAWLALLAALLGAVEIAFFAAFAIYEGDGDAAIRVGPPLLGCIWPTLVIIQMFAANALVAVYTVEAWTIVWSLRAALAGACTVGVGLWLVIVM